MRILLLVVAGFVVLILAVMVTGWSLPKRHVVSRSAFYRATPERLFSLIAGAQDWRPDLLRSETVPDAGGRELLRETTRDGETITYELLDRMPPASVKRRIATENLPYSGTWTFTIQPQDEGAVLRITEEGEVYNPLFRFTSRLIFGQTRTMESYLRSLGKATGQEIQIKD